MNSHTFSQSKYFDSRWFRDTGLEGTRIRQILSLIGTGSKILDVGSYNGGITRRIKEQGNYVEAADASAAFADSYKGWGIPLELLENCLFGLSPNIINNRFLVSIPNTSTSFTSSPKMMARIT